MTTYHIELDDGTATDIEATSAADAVGRALERNIGRTIHRCWSGDKFKRTHGLRGFIDYDIPKLVGLTEAPARRKRQKPDLSNPLFPDYKP